MSNRILSVKQKPDPRVFNFRLLTSKIFRSHHLLALLLLGVLHPAAGFVQTCMTDRQSPSCNRLSNRVGILMLHPPFRSFRSTPAAAPGGLKRLLQQ